MSKHSVSVIENTVHKLYEWLHDIREALRLESLHDAYVILRALLHAIRDRVPPESAVKFAAQLPIVIKGIYYDEWALRDVPVKVHQPREFVELVESYMNSTKLSPLSIDEIAEVLKVIAQHTAAEEIQKIGKLFPEKIKETIFESVVSELE